MKNKKYNIELENRNKLYRHDKKNNKNIIIIKIVFIYVYIHGK